MKKVIALTEQLENSLTFREKYPMFKMDDEKVHILFLSPCLNESGYYRMILPAIELNKTETHCAILAHIHRWDFNKLFDDYDHPVSPKLVKWTDYLVLPTMFSDASYIIDLFKNTNPRVKFIMDLDLDYHDLPDYHPYQKKLSDEAKENLLRNLSYMNYVTAPNWPILHKYNTLASASPLQFKFSPLTYRNLISNETFEGISELNRGHGIKVRLGMIMDGFMPEDLITIEEVLSKVLAQHKDTAELIVYGWSEKFSSRYNILKGTGVTFKHVVGTTAYPEYLNSLGFDIGLIPFVNNLYNRSGRVHNRFFELSSLAIPSVTLAVPPFTGMIKDGENGFLARTSQEWYDKINLLITDSELRTAMGRAASETVWKTHSYINPGATKRLQNIFI